MARGHGTRGRKDDGIIPALKRSIKDVPAGQRELFARQIDALEKYVVASLLELEAGYRLKMLLRTAETAAED